VEGGLPSEVSRIVVSFYVMLGIRDSKLRLMGELTAERENAWRQFGRNGWSDAAPYVAGPSFKESAVPVFSPRNGHVLPGGYVHDALRNMIFQTMMELETSQEAKVRWCEWKARGHFRDLRWRERKMDLQRRRILGDDQRSHDEAFLLLRSGVSAYVREMARSFVRPLPAQPKVAADCRVKMRAAPEEGLPFLDWDDAHAGVYANANPIVNYFQRQGPPKATNARFAWNDRCSVVRWSKEKEAPEGGAPVTEETGTVLGRNLAAGYCLWAMTCEGGTIPDHLRLCRAVVERGVLPREVVAIISRYYALLGMREFEANVASELVRLEKYRRGRSASPICAGTVCPTGWTRWGCAHCFSARWKEPGNCSGVVFTPDSEFYLPFSAFLLVDCLNNAVATYKNEMQPDGPRCTYRGPWTAPIHLLLSDPPSSSEDLPGGDDVPEGDGDNSAIDAEAEETEEMEEAEETEETEGMEEAEKAKMRALMMGGVSAYARALAQSFMRRDPKQGLDGASNVRERLEGFLQSFPLPHMYGGNWWALACESHQCPDDGAFHRYFPDSFIIPWVRDEMSFAPALSCEVVRRRHSCATSWLNAGRALDEAIPGLENCVGGLDTSLERRLVVAYGIAAVHRKNNAVEAPDGIVTQSK
jgi:hypothetical protein